ncbi:MAG: cyclase family protein [Actinobacteria bacterium]|nr:cyclase family protein [Actinomycetota bacterium]
MINFPEYTVVDLTLPLGPETMMWPGEAAPFAEVVETVKHDDNYARRVQFYEHSGTHVDAPNHFVEGGQAVTDLPLQTLISPAVVIDASVDINGNGDAVLELATVKAWEEKHGVIPAGCVVLLRTGWEDLYDQPQRYSAGPDGLHFPGFGVEAASYLVECGVVGIGIDTLGIDAGADLDFPVHRDVTLPKQVWHIENLTNLKSLPATGALVFIGVLPLVDGSGSPARILALVPKS